MNFSCKQCRAWSAGTCHRHPPQIVWASGTMFSAFPQTRPDEFCQEYLSPDLEPIGQPPRLWIDVVAEAPKEPINRARGTTPAKR